MIIGVCGFCSTGSSAVSDYLKEFDENQVLDMLEFTLTYLPDGLEDLEYHLTKKYSRGDDCYCAITRFRRYMDRYYINGGAKITKKNKKIIKEITEKFLYDIVQLKWITNLRSELLLNDGLFYRYFGISIMKQRIIPFINKKLKRAVTLYPNHEVEVSIGPANFDISSKKFVKEMLSCIGANFSKNIVLDQPFSGNDPEKSFHFFDDPRAIVVDRDPRDNYLFAKKMLYKKGRFMPIDKVEDFVKYYKLLRDNQPYKLPNKRILRIQFEDMVYNYEATTERIRQFCELPESRKKFTIFDPKISMPNTQLFRRYPEYKKEIEYIEKNLTEYLFDFQKYPVPVIHGDMFIGKSPLDRK